MDSIIVKGGKKLNGEIKISGAKNAALPILAATLLTEDKVKLKNIPNLVDIHTMISLLQNHGAKYEKIAHNEIEIENEDIFNKTAPYDIVRKMRASIWVLGPLLARFGEAKVSLPGGCAIGARMVDQHIEIMEKLGAEIINKDGYLIAKSNGRLKGCRFNFSKITVGGTINGILAATLAEGRTILTNCALEPEIVDLCNFLVKMGAKISGIGSSTVIIDGVEKLSGATHSVIGDRIEAGTYMMAVGLIGGKIKLSSIDHRILDNVILKLLDVGLKIEIFDEKGNLINLTEEKTDDFQYYQNSSIIIESPSIIKNIDLDTEPYPGFATDLQAQYMSLMTKSCGRSVISENIFENRFMHVPELCRMGADIKIDGNKAFVTGVEKLSSAEVMATDLRASSSLVIAGLAAEGITKIRRIYHLDRGYENLEEKLRNCGVYIERVQGDNA